MLYLFHFVFFGCKLLSTAKTFEFWDFFCYPWYFCTEFLSCAFESKLVENFDVDVGLINFIVLVGKLLDFVWFFAACLAHIFTCCFLRKGAEEAIAIVVALKSQGVKTIGAAGFC